MLGIRTRHGLFAAAVLLAAAAGCVHAGTVVDSARAFLAARAGALGSDPVVTIHNSPVAMPTCTHPQPFLPGHGQHLLGRVTVGVRCGDNHVRYLQARVSVTGRYWVAGERIAAGSVVAKSMLQALTGNLARLPRNTARQRKNIVGKVTTRALAKGSVVLQSQLKAPALVHHSQRVTVEAVGAGFRVTRAGKALQDGGMGATVRVRMDNREVLTGVVSGDNLVKASF